MNGIVKMVLITLIGTAVSIAILSRIPAVWTMIKKGGA